MADYNPQLSKNSEEISKKITEAFYAFAEFCPAEAYACWMDPACSQLMAVAHSTGLGDSSVQAAFAQDALDALRAHAKARENRGPESPLLGENSLVGAGDSTTAPGDHAHMRLPPPHSRLPMW